MRHDDIVDEEEQSSSSSRSGKNKTPALDAFGRDLNESARKGELDPGIGRAGEIERVIQVLCRRTKNNPVLIGEPGVGKSAIVEGLAQALDFPLDRCLVTLDRFGNTAAASIPLALSLQAEAGGITRGDKILLICGAAGFTAGVMPVIW